GAITGAPASSFNLNSRCSSRTLAVVCSTTDRMPTYQIHVKWNPVTRDSRIAGITLTSSRSPEVASDGIVLPSAWNMLDPPNVTPEKTNVTNTMRRYSTPTCSTAGSFVKMPISAGANV